MLQVRQRKNTGLQGLANVRNLKESLRIQFVADGDVWDVSKEGHEDIENGQYNVTLTKQNDKILFLSPPFRTEPYLVKFHEFGNRSQLGIPEVKIEPAHQGFRKDNGKPYYIPQQPVFSAKLVVVENGIYEGLSIAYKLPYIFTQNPGEMTTGLEGSTKQNEKLTDFLRACGVDLMTIEIPWQVNILPWLEAQLKATDKIFQVNLDEKGFVASLGTVSSFLLDQSKIAGSNGKNGKKPAAKKGAKKSKKEA